MQIIEYMLASNQDEDEGVALEAAEFWLAFCEAQIPADVLRPFLPRLIPVLMKNMVGACGCLRVPCCRCWLMQCGAVVRCGVVRTVLGCLVRLVARGPWADVCGAVSAVSCGVTVCCVPCACAAVPVVRHSRPLPLCLLQVFSEDDEEVVEATAAEGAGEDSAKDLKPFHHSSAEHTAGEEGQGEGEEEEDGLGEQVGAAAGESGSQSVCSLCAVCVQSVCSLCAVCVQAVCRLCAG